MSLRSTIDAAREEAKEVAADRSVPKEKADDKKASAKTEYDPMNLGKRTAANAKPATEAGASVRTGNGSSKANIATMSKAHLHGRNLLQRAVVRAGADISRVHDDVGTLELVEQVGLQEAVRVRDDVVAHDCHAGSPTARARA